MKQPNFGRSVYSSSWDGESRPTNGITLPKPTWNAEIYAAEVAAERNSPLSLPIHRRCKEDGCRGRVRSDKSERCNDCRRARRLSIKLKAGAQ